MTSSEGRNRGNLVVHSHIFISYIRKFEVSHIESEKSEYTMVDAGDRKFTSQIEFVNRLDERHKCPICRNVFIEPCQTSCGHRFCRNCFEGHFGLENTKCPIDGEPIFRGATFPDKYCEREILNLQCFCRYKGRSCNWKGEFRHLKDHLEVCLKFPIRCILNCGKEDIPRGMMEEHVTTHCPKAEHLCPFSCHGCQFKGNAEHLDQHIKSSIESHLHMMNYSTHEQNKKNKEMEEKFSRLENEKKTLEQRLQNQTEELAYARQNIQMQHTKISMVEKSVLEQQKEIENILRSLPLMGPSGANTDVVSSQVEEIVNTIRRHEDKVNNVLQSELARLKISAATPNAPDVIVSSSSSRECEGQLDRAEHQFAAYIWKIDHYSQRFQEAVSGKRLSIYSPPFYVGRFGYKVCTLLYPNGDGIGKGTHMSMFFVIMRGEYDALLPWPFIQKVHFRLIDQDKIRDACDAFQPEPSSSSFKRPTSEMNIATGCPTFISQTELRQGGFIRNGTMSVKITVDMTGLQGEMSRL